MHSLSLLVAALVALPTALATVSSATTPGATPTPTVISGADGWQELGCFEESSAGTLSFFFDDSPSMTVQACVDLCDKAGFILAGVEAGTECHCGNIIKDGGTPAMIDSCGVSCGGDKTISCGGIHGQRILLYERTPFVVPTEVPKVKRWKSLGCWSDSQQQRALHHDGGGSDGQTVEDCVAICEDGGFALAGVEFGLQCFCGNAMLFDHEPTDSSACSTACAGDPNELCGGRNALNVYQFGSTPFTSGPATVLQSFGDWKYLNCVGEASSGRAIPNSMSIDIEQMTVEACLTACDGASFNVAGLQFGEECFCGNVTLPPGPVLDDSACNLPCNNNADEICGGPGANSVYYLPTATFSDTPRK